jgi:hypothetical protein
MDFIPLTAKVKTKKENCSSDTSSSSSSSSSTKASFSFLDQIKNIKEVSLQSVTNKSDGKPVSFKPDTNYKFSTFLMLLKDLHDTRDREGAPLELDIGPASSHVKPEPSVIPGTSGQDPHRGATSACGAVLVADEAKTSQKDGVTNGRRPGQPSKGSGGRKRTVNSARRKKAPAPYSPASSGPGFPGQELSSGGDSRSGDGQVQTEGGKGGVVVEEGCGAVKEGESRTTVPLEGRLLDAARFSPPKTSLQPPKDLHVEGATLNNNSWGGSGGGQETSKGKDLPEQ